MSSEFVWFMLTIAQKILLLALFAVTLSDFNSLAYAGLSHWLLFSATAEGAPKVYRGLITLDSSPQLKSVAVKANEYLSGVYFSSTSKGVRFEMNFTPDTGEMHSFPETKNTRADKIKIPYFEGQCESCCRFHSHSLMNLKYNRVKHTLFYRRKNHEWFFLNSSNRYIDVGFSDKSQGQALPFLLDVLFETTTKQAVGSTVNIKSQALDATPDISSDHGAGFEISTSKSEIVTSGQKALLDIFSKQWKKGYFDPLFGTDCLWSVHVISGNITYIEFTDENGGKYWLILSDDHSQKNSSSNDGLSPVLQHMINGTVSAAEEVESRANINKLLDGFFTRKNTRHDQAAESL